MELITSPYKPILADVLTEMTDSLIDMINDIKITDNDFQTKSEEEEQEEGQKNRTKRINQLRIALLTITENRDRVENAKEILSQMKFLDISPSRIREPVTPSPVILADSGENLPIILKEIYEDPKRRKILMSWLTELTPMDVEKLEFPSDPSDRVHLRLCEKNGREVSAYSASDGTLRFLAMLAVLVNETPKHLYFFEEIDNGIHPARQWLLLDLIEKQVKKANIQVITTTHSPELLTYANDNTFDHISVVSRLEDSSDAIIRRVADLPNAQDLRKSQGLGRLLAGGWMENILAFSENQDEIEEVSE